MRPPQPPRTRVGDASSVPSAPSSRRVPAPTAVASLDHAAERPQPLPSLQVRLLERTRAARRASLRRIGMVALVASAAVALLWVAFASPLFAFDPTRLTVEDPGGTAENAVVQEFADAYAGVPLPRLDTSGLADRLEGEPGIRTAVVQRVWPRGLVVTLEPRLPAAAVPAEEGMVLFDAEGVRIGVGAPPEGIPVVDVPLGEEDTARTLQAALAVLAALPDELRPQVAGVSATNADSITLTLSDGATVRWGGNAENELKARVLETLRQLPASVYDISTPRRPITR